MLSETCESYYLMMKKLILLTLCICTALSLAAQSQPGYVKTIGKPGKKGVGLGGVTVRAKGGHNAVLSNADGTFSIPMPDKKNGQAYALQQVQKKGYELNEKGVIGRNYTFSPSISLPLVMVSSAQLQADKQRIENKAYESAEKNYKAKIAKLEKQLKDKTISEEQYRAAIQELQEKFEKYQSLIESLAEHYAHTDYDELSEKEAEINILIENSELEKADSLIHTLFNPLDVLKRNKEAMAQINQIITDAQGIIQQANEDYAAILKQQLKDAEHLYQLYTIALAQYELDNALNYIEIRAALDTTNIEWQYDAYVFYKNEFFFSDEDWINKSEIYYDRIINQNNAFYAMLANNDKAQLCIWQVDYDQALEYYQNALNYSKALYGENDSLVAISYTNIADVYVYLQDFQQSIEYYNHALDILKSLFNENNCYVADIYMKMGNALITHNRIEAKNKYLNAFMIYHSLNDSSKMKESLELICRVNENCAEEQLQTNINIKLATTFFNENLSLIREYYGDNSQEIANRYESIINECIFNNIPELASEYAYKALDHFGNDNILSANISERLGFIYLCLNDIPNSIKYYENATNICSKYHNNENPILVDCFKYMGYISAKRGDYAQSIESLTKAYKIAMNIWTKYQNNDYKNDPVLSHKDPILFFNQIHNDAITIETEIQRIKYNLALLSNNIPDFLSDHIFFFTVEKPSVVTIAQNEISPAQQQGMSGEYVLLEFDDWREDSPVSLFDKSSEYKGKPKDIVVLKDGVISKHHFEDVMGVQLGVKEITKEERERINQLYKTWKKDQALLDVWNSRKKDNSVNKQSD